MIPGFNTDFKYRGETYHVQTEDNGVGNPVVVSLLYHKGAILASRRTPYNDLVDRPGFAQELAALMKNQHKDLMRSLLAGTFDKDGSAPMIAGGSGEHPAAAAAAVALTATPAPTTQGLPLPTPLPVATAATAKPLHVPFAELRTAAAVLAAPLPQPATRVAALTLDAAIWDYLKQFAATAGMASPE